MSETQKYVDYFLRPVPKSELGAYEKFGDGMAELAKKHGALGYIIDIADIVSFLHALSSDRLKSRNPTGSIGWH